MLICGTNLKRMLSIIICTYNREKYLYKCLKSIAENDFPFSEYEVVLINNNSTDNTETECKKFQNDFPQVNFNYFVEYNQGLSYARNRGIAESKGEVLIFLDDDSFVGKDYLKNLSDNLDKCPDYSAFGGKITPKFENAHSPKWISKWTYSWVSAIDLGDRIQEFRGEKYPIGANMGIKADILSKIGNFNTKLGRNKKNLMAGEEKDIFNRIKNLGGKIFYFPNIEVQHVIPPQRTTDTYIAKMGLGIEMSEKLRTLDISKIIYLKRLMIESVKWVASILLLLIFLIKCQPQKGTKLILFRWNVTKGLLITDKK
jgi:glycosyltransferase involved in cell wall biosynthesis